MLSPGHTVALNAPGSMLEDVVGSIVISLSCCCLQNDEGPGPPQIFFSRTPLGGGRRDTFLAGGGDGGIRRLRALLLTVNGFQWLYGCIQLLL